MDGKNYNMIPPEMRDLIHLLRCALRGVSPAADEVVKMPLEQVFTVAKKHSLAAVSCLPLETYDGTPAAWKAARNRALQRSILLDAERHDIQSRLEENGIWYLPLKGCVIQQYYPCYGTREMVDIDILFDSFSQNKVKDFMLERGYKAKYFGNGNEDVYLKNPIYNFEFHTKLVPSDSPFSGYYADVKSRLIRCGSTMEYRFSDEDFYLYMIAHANKHFTISGTGLRTLLDLYVYLQAKADGLDFSYISGELEKLGLSDFEAVCRSLSEKLFGAETVDFDSLNACELDVLLDILGAGTYGSVELLAEKGLRRQQHAAASATPSVKLRYLLHRFYPGRQYFINYYTVCSRLPVLVPFYVILRAIGAFTGRRKAVLREMKAVRKMK